MLKTVGVGPAFAAGSKEEEEARFAERVRAGNSKLSTGAQARIEIRLRDKTKLKGYVSESNRETFTVIDASGVATEIAYPQVRRVKGNNLSEGVRIAIVVGIVVAVIILAGTVFAGN